MIGFRVDANEYIASGHIVRCITIANEFVKLGYECIFYLAENKELWRLEEKNLSYRILNSDWKNICLEKELLGNIIKKDGIDWLIVDSYQADNEYLTYLNGFCKVAYIDDMALSKYDIAAVIHYGIYDGLYEKKYEKTSTLCLSGPRYIPLRDEFNKKNVVNKREKNILVTTGGTDKYNVLLDFLKCFVECDVFKDYGVYIIIGSMNAYENDILEFTKKESRLYVLKNISNISYYMRICEFAVSAGGTTLYELCVCKTPTVCFSFADNQYEFVKQMEKEKVMLCAGDPRFDCDIGRRIVSCLIKIKNNDWLKMKFVNNMECLLDGKGATRIAKRLLKNNN